MAIKATIYKVGLQLADMDRQIYRDHELTIARHPSETDERLLIRLLAFALSLPASDDGGALGFAKDMWDPEEPALWQKDLTGQTLHWIEVGQPEEKRLLQASSRAGRVSVYSFSAATSQWWSGLATKLTRWQIPSRQSHALTALANRSMKLDVTVQDGAIWMGDGQRSFEVSLQRLFGTANPAS